MAREIRVPIASARCLGAENKRGKDMTSPTDPGSPKLRKDANGT